MGMAEDASMQLELAGSISSVMVDRAFLILTPRTDLASSAPTWSSRRDTPYFANPCTRHMRSHLYCASTPVQIADMT